MFLAELFMQQFLKLFFADMSFIKQTLKHQLLLFFPGGMWAQQDIHIKNMVEMFIISIGFVERPLQFIEDVFIEKLVIFYWQGFIGKCIYFHGFTYIFDF